MNLFHFNPNTYGQQWFVMAASRETAIVAVQAWVDKQPGPSSQDESGWSERGFYQERLDLYKAGGLQHASKRTYIIEEHGVEDVIPAEIC